jgi:hypothetical protein
VIESLRSRRTALKWRPRQKFVLTPDGKVARDGWKATVGALPRGEGAREALASARTAWAAEHLVEGGDATVLAEFGTEPVLARQLLGLLDESGLTLADVQDALDRLYAAGLIAPADGVPPEVRGQA